MSARPVALFLLALVSAAVRPAALAASGDDLRGSEAAEAVAEAGPGLPPVPAVLACVGESIITQRDVDEFLGTVLREKLGRLLEARRRAKKAGDWEAVAEDEFQRLRDGFEREVRKALLHRALVEESALSSGYRPDDVMIELRLKADAHRAGGVEELERKTGRTVSQMREELRRRDLHTHFRADRVPHGVAPGPVEVRAYYAANRRRLVKPPLVKLRVLEVPVEGDRERARETAEDLRRELQFKPSRFVRRVQDLARTEEERARAGLVVDRTTGKVVEWVPMNAVPPGVARAIENVKPGEVSGVIEDKDVFLLIKLEGRKAAEPVTLAEALEAILDEYARRREDRILEEWSSYYLREAHIADGDGRRITAGSFVGD